MRIHLYNQAPRPAPPPTLAAAALVPLAPRPPLAAASRPGGREDAQRRSQPANGNPGEATQAYSQGAVCSLSIFGFGCETTASCKMHHWSGTAPALVYPVPFPAAVRPDVFIDRGQSGVPIAFVMYETALPVLPENNLQS